MRSKVSVTLGSSSTIRMVRVAAGVDTATEFMCLGVSAVIVTLRRRISGQRGSFFTRHPCYSRDFVSPILVRPVREQLEHDRVIRLLQTKFRRRFDVGINPGSEQNSPVGAGIGAVYPDVVLVSQDRGRKVMAVIEVETVESVNNLEALAEWIPFGRLKSPFHLYVPASMV